MSNRKDKNNLNYDEVFEQNQSLKKELKELKNELQQTKFIADISMKDNLMGNWEVDVINHKHYWSDNYCRLLGYTERVPSPTQELFYSHVHEDDLANVKDTMNKSITSKQPATLEFKFIHKNGSIRHAVSTANYLLDDNDNIVKIIGVFQDITLQKEFLTKLSDSEQKYKSLYENAPLSYQSLDIEGNFIDINPTWLSTLGYSRDEVIGNNYADFLHPEWRNHFRKNFPEFKKRGYVSDVQFKIRHKDGHYLDISFDGCIGTHPDGSFRQTYCVFNDITEQRRTEDALQKIESVQRKMVSNIGDVIVIIDKNGFNRFESSNVKEHFGWEPHELVGKSTFDIVHPEDVESAKEILKKLEPQNNKSTTAEIRLRHKNGSYKWIKISLVNMLDDPDIKGFLGNYHDITEDKKLEDALIRVSRDFSLLSGHDFYTELCMYLASSLDVNIVFFGELVGNNDTVNVVFGMDNGEVIDGLSYKLENTPCLNVIEGDVCVYPTGIQQKFPYDRLLFEMGVDGYAGIPIINSSGKSVGILVVLSREPLKSKDLVANMLQVFSGRIATELERQKFEESIVNAKEIAEQNERLLSKIAENYPNSYLSIIEKDLSVGFTSGQEFKKLNVDPETFVGLTLKEVFGEHTEFIKEKYLDTFQGVEQDFELYNNDQYQKYRTVPLTDDNGVINKILSVVENITEQKQNELELLEAKEIAEQSELKFKALYDNSPDMYASVSPYTAEILFCNETLLKETGYSRSELIGKPVYNLYHIDSRDAGRDAFNEFKNKGRVFNKELVLSKKGGDKIHVSLNVNSIKDKEGKVMYSMSSWRNINERVRLRELHKKNELKYEKLISTMMNGFALCEMIFDDKGKPYNFKYLEVNPAWEKLMGYRKEDVLGKTIREINPDVEQSWIEFFGRIVDTGIPEEIDDYNEASGKYFHVYGYRPEKGRFAVFYIDITQKKKAATALRKSEAELKEAQEIARLGSWEMIVETEWINWSEENFNIFGIEPPPEGGLTFNQFMEYVLPEDHNAIYELWKSLETDGEADFSYRIIRPDNHIRWISGKGKTHFDEEGNAERMVGVLQDVTDTKVQEIEIIKAKDQAENINIINEARLKLIQFSETHSTDEIIEETLNIAEQVSHSKIGFYHFIEDDQKSLTLQNWSTQTKNKYCKALGFGLHYSIDKAGVWVDCLHERKPVVHNDYNSLKHKKGLPDGHAELVRELVVPVIYQDKVKAILGVGNKEQDYTQIDIDNIQLLSYFSWEILEKKKMHENLLEAKIKAEESDRLKSAFLSNMSHEIRTPMNGIVGFTELLQNPKISQDRHKGYLEVIRNSCDRLLNTVNDIVEVSKIESGEVEIRKSPIDIFLEVKKLGAFFSPECEKKGLNLIVENYGNISSYNTDEIKLHSIMSNLIKNAIKYTKTGYIKTGFKVGNDTLTFYCKDTGIGVPKDRQEAIFNRFEQADIEDKDAFQGSGLGLSIVKSYASMLGGKAWVESKEGEGSEFLVCFPFEGKSYRSGRTKVSRDPNVTINSNIRTLIAEDDEVSLSHLLILLENDFKNVQSVTNGKDAIDMIKDDPGIDLILMDMKMPVVDGYDATKEIRKFNKDVIIIAQTAFAFEEDRQKMIDAGCNDVISKPIKSDLLFDIIGKYFSHSEV